MTARFRFHDSMTNSVRDFESLERDVVRMYNCGPTVYSSPQIGNWRSNVAWDVLRRALELGGYRVRQIMNLTDVGHLTEDDFERGDDKLEEQARKERLTAVQIAEKYIAEFFEGVDALHFLRAECYPRATAHIAEMIEIIETLVARGNAYVTPAGNVYFDVASFPAYGALSHNSVEDLEAGARVEVLDEKRHPADFALWKRDEKHQMQWDSPWGRGFPGWHIECSAMSRKYLGDTLDIHTGGEDNVFPHHECEIAQSEAFTGHTFVRYWLHTRHLLVDGAKMSKSKGTQYVLADVSARGHSMRALRYFLLATHYRVPMNFTWDGVAAAEAAVARLDAMVRGLVEDAARPRDPALAALCDRVDAAFLDALRDDLNTSAALAVVHGFRNDVNRSPALAPGDLRRVRETIARIDSVLALDLLSQPDGATGSDADSEVERLVGEREAARKARDWSRADALRDEIVALGVVLEDTPKGVRWYRS